MSSSIDRPSAPDGELRGPERAVLLHVALNDRVAAADRQEFSDLAHSAGVQEVGALSASLRSPRARYLIGTGKLDELADLVEQTEAHVVLVDAALSPSQERNLERRLSCRVLDRSGLILDIFAQRARTFEGKLQVELAQLRHLSTRLVRGWTHLERQKGGIGLRGPGETQLETDRRLLGHRIRTLRQRLNKVDKQRHLGRQTRQRAEVPTVSLVGYTNAGKSTLFNCLTGANVYSADQLFATLDPTLRQLALPDCDAAVLADTVGFVRSLPHELVAAFRATLQETREASLLLHVIDASDEQRRDRMAEVASVLEQIGANDLPQLEVWNKIDLSGDVARVDRDENGLAVRVWVCAATGEGMPQLLDAIAQRLRPPWYHGVLHLGPQHARMRARLFEAAAVKGEQVCEDGGWDVQVGLAKRALERICKDEGFELSLPARYATCADTGGFLQSRASKADATPGAPG